MKQERIQPLVSDFLFICDGAYKQPELIRMEMEVFRVIGYDLGIPLSYRFLRRYARVSDGAGFVCQPMIGCIFNSMVFLFAVC